MKLTLYRVKGADAFENLLLNPDPELADEVESSDELTTGKVASLLGVGTGEVKELIKGGYLKQTENEDGKLVVFGRDLLRFVNKQLEPVELRDEDDEDAKPEKTSGEFDDDDDPSDDLETIILAPVSTVAKLFKRILHSVETGEPLTEPKEKPEQKDGKSAKAEDDDKPAKKNPASRVRVGRRR